LLNARKHLSATEKLIAICQAFGDITNAHDCELCRELSRRSQTACWWMT
jgi:recombinational DNA repair protein RecR